MSGSPHGHHPYLRVFDPLADIRTLWLERTLTGLLLGPGGRAFLPAFGEQVEVYVPLRVRFYNFLVQL
jgi:hypothetical protein